MFEVWLHIGKACNVELARDIRSSSIHDCLIAGRKLQHSTSWTPMITSDTQIRPQLRFFRFNRGKRRKTSSKPPPRVLVVHPSHHCEGRSAAPTLVHGEATLDLTTAQWSPWRDTSRSHHRLSKSASLQDDTCEICSSRCAWLSSNAPVATNPFMELTDDPGRSISHQRSA